MKERKEYFKCVIAYDYAVYFSLEELSCDQVYDIATTIVDEMVEDPLVLEDINNGLTDYDAMRAFIEQHGGVSSWFITKSDIAKIE